MVSKYFKETIEEAIRRTSYCDLIKDEVRKNGLGIYTLQYDVNTEEPYHPVKNIIGKINMMTMNKYTILRKIQEDDTSTGIFDRGRYIVKIMVI